MKRIALTLAAFALTGALAFADDMAAPAAKLSGYVNDGVILTNNSNGTYLYNYGNDYGSGNPGTTVKIGIDLAGSNFGYSLAPTWKGTTFAVDHAYAWANPADGVTLEASFAGNTNPIGDLDDNGAGAFSTSGLSGWYTSGGFTIAAELALPAVASTTAVPLIAGVRYGVDKLFTLNAYGSNGNSNTLDSVHVTASLAAVPGLTLTGGYNASGMAVKTADFIDATVGYAISDALSAGVVVYDRNISNGTNFINYKPNLSYAVSPMVSISAYLIGDTSSSPNYEPQVLLAFKPVAGATIKASVWIDTNSSSIGYNNANAGVVQKSSSSETSADVDFIYSF